jgi:hypothetical protein
VGAASGWHSAKTRQLVPRWRKLYVQLDPADSCGGNDNPQFWSEIEEEVEDKRTQETLESEFGFKGFSPLR